MPFRKNNFPKLRSEAQKLLENIPKKVGVHLVNQVKERLKSQVDIDGKAFKTRNPDFREGGATLIERGKLLNSVRFKATGNRIHVMAGDNQEVQYAEIHNEGGAIKVTEKMKRYHWAMENKFRATPKGGFHKAMALKKVGSTITIPKRKYLGYNNEVKELIQKIVRNEMLQLKDLNL